MSFAINAALFNENVDNNSHLEKNTIETKKLMRNKTIKKRDNYNVEAMIQKIHNNVNKNSDNDENELSDFIDPQNELTFNKQKNISFQKPLLNDENNTTEPFSKLTSYSNENEEHNLNSNRENNSYQKNIPNYYNQMSEGTNLNNELLDKLNYMVHLLEEQKDEKTNHVTEEIILYSFLGVFMIFIIDSFARASKYIR